MRRNTRHNYGPEINELIGLRARITRQINKRTEGATP
jgi:RNase P/RNase MRP subunit p29